MDQVRHARLLVVESHVADAALGCAENVLGVCSEVCEAGKIGTRRSWALLIILLSDTGDAASEQFPRDSALELRRAVFREPQWE